MSAHVASACQSGGRSEEHTSELQSHVNIVCRLLLEKKKNFSQDVSTRTGFVVVRTSPGSRTLTLPLSGGLATTAATRAGRPLERGFTKRSGTKPDTILSSGAGSTKRMLLSLGDMPGLTSHAIHKRCPTLKGIDRDLQQYDRALEH